MQISSVFEKVPGAPSIDAQRPGTSEVGRDEGARESPHLLAVLAFLPGGGGAEERERGL